MLKARDAATRFRAGRRDGHASQALRPPGPGPGRTVLLPDGVEVTRTGLRPRSCSLLLIATAVWVAL